MRKPGFVLLCVAAAIIAALASYRLDCKLNESAFQRRLEQLKQDANRQLKIGTTKEEAFRFFSTHGLQVRTDQTGAWGLVLTSRGCTRGWGCSIGPDGGMISVSVTFDGRGNVDSAPVIKARYAGDCS